MHHIVQVMALIIKNIKQDVENFSLFYFFFIYSIVRTMDLMGVRMDEDSVVKNILS